MPAAGELLVSFWRRTADFFGLKRNLVVLLVATFVIGAGEELWMRFVPKYLEALGATVFVIGLFDALRTLLGAVYAYPGGILVDRWGHRRAFLAFNILSIAGYSLVLLVPHWGAVIAGMFLFLSWTCFSLPATFSLIGATLGANRHSMGVGIQSVIKRLPIMVAPIVGGILIDRFGVINGVRIGLIVSIALSAATILVQRQLRETPLLPAVARPERWTFWQSLRGFNAPLSSAPPERYSRSFLRTNPLRLGRDLRHGQRRRKRKTGWLPHHRRSARRHPLHHPGLAFRR